MKKNLVNNFNQDNGILRLTLDDENNKNALSEAMIGELTEAINEANGNKEVKVIVIASTGNVFCSGHNLKEITAARNNNDKGAEYFKNLFESCSSLMQLIVSCSKPVIAEVGGIATAAGCQLVASCDLAISSNIAKFATPGVNIGLFCSTPMVALSRNVSKKEAMKMLLTGDMISADEAKNISLINDYVSEDELTETVMELAQKIAQKSSMTLKTGKKAFYKQFEMNLYDAYEYTSRVMAENVLKDDAKEGIESFINKRDPNWSDN
jgi:enoyl-CoA hydratase/carnithine racemase|tara:strand:- start:6 stop:803 length:798 start_codon:yes stop_codon:yes gene_type:complete